MKKREEVERNSQQLLLCTKTVIVLGHLNGECELVVVSELLQRVEYASAFFDINGIKLIIRFHNEFQFRRCLALCDQPLLLRTDALQKYTGRFIGRVLGVELSLYGHLLNGFLELIGKHIGKFFKLLFCLSVLI